jgi:protein TonB
MVFITIILLHLGFYWALTSGLAQAGLEIVQDIVAVDLPPPPPKPEDVKEPPPPPPIDRPPPTVPPPLIDLGPDTGPSSAISNVVMSNTPTAARPIAAPPPRPVDVTPPRLDLRRLGDRARPNYPSASRRLGEEGVVMLLVRVGTDGRVSDCQVDQSSGFPRLDEAAKEHVAKYYRFSPATSGGQPIEGTVRIPIRFKLEE